MPFLKVGGVEFPVASRSNPGASVVYVGERGRTFSGSLRNATRAEKGEWRGSTPWADKATTDLYRNLISGQGHSWTFDASSIVSPSSTTLGLASSKGLTPAINTGGTAWTFLPHRGERSCFINQSQQVRWDLAYFPYTVLLWHLDTTWKHHVFRSDGAHWLDGVSAAAPTWFAMGSGNLTLTAPATGSFYVDDMVAFPYLISTSWVAGMYAAHTAAVWPNLPRVRIEGDWPNRTTTAEVELGQTVAADSTSTYFSFDFVLQEV